jgi:hypothetical protein
MYRHYTVAAGRNPWRQYLPPSIIKFPTAPLAYVNKLKILLARDAYDVVITINRMNRQLDKHIIKNLGGGEKSNISMETDPRDFNQWSQYSFPTPLIT